MTFTGSTFDVFISYAHIDNLPLTEEEGWVTHFHNALNIRLPQLVGTKATIAIPIFQARLFDIAPTLQRLLGLGQPGQDTGVDAGEKSDRTESEYGSASNDLGTDADPFKGRPLVVAE